MVSSTQLGLNQATVIQFGMHVSFVENTSQRERGRESITLQQPFIPGTEQRIHTIKHENAPAHHEFCFEFLPGVTHVIPENSIQSLIFCLVETSNGSMDSVAIYKREEFHCCTSRLIPLTRVLVKEKSHSRSGDILEGESNAIFGLLLKQKSPWQWATRLYQFGPWSLFSSQSRVLVSHVPMQFRSSLGLVSSSILPPDMDSKVPPNLSESTRIKKLHFFSVQAVSSVKVLRTKGFFLSFKRGRYKVHESASGVYLGCRTGPLLENYRKLSVCVRFRGLSIQKACHPQSLLLLCFHFFLRTSHLILSM